MSAQHLTDWPSVDGPIDNSINRKTDGPLDGPLDRLSNRQLGGQSDGPLDRPSGRPRQIYTLPIRIKPNSANDKVIQKEKSPPPALFYQVTNRTLRQLSMSQATVRSFYGLKNGQKDADKFVEEIEDLVAHGQYASAEAIERSIHIQFQTHMKGAADRWYQTLAANVRSR